MAHRSGFVIDKPIYTLRGLNFIVSASFKEAAYCELVWKLSQMWV